MTNVFKYCVIYKIDNFYNDHVQKFKTSLSNWLVPQIRHKLPIDLEPF